MLKPLKKYGIKRKELRTSCIELNDAAISDVPAIPVGTKVKGPDLLLSFLNAIDTIPDDCAEDIPETVASFYKGLPQAVYDDEDSGDGVGADEPRKEETAKTTKKSTKAKEKKAKKKVEAEEEAVADVTSDCPSFKKNFNAEDTECVACKKDFPDEYDACSAVCNAKAEEEAASKPSARKKTIGKRTRYGHQIGSMCGLVDDMVWKGMTEKAMIKKIMKKFDRSERLASGRVMPHINNLVKKGLATFEEREDNIIKTVEEFAEGFNAENTGS